MHRFSHRFHSRPLEIVATARPEPREGRGPVWHIVGGPQGPWPAFANASEAAGSRLGFVDVGCANILGELHVCATTEDGRTWHTIRHRNGSWLPFIEIPKGGRWRLGDMSRVALSPAQIKALDCVAIGRDLHVCAVDEKGGLFHSIRHGSSWDPFSNVKRMVEHDPGEFSDVGCASAGENLHVCAITPPSGVWHAIRWGDGSWESGFADLTDSAGDPGNPYKVDCAVASWRNDLDIFFVVVLADDGRGLRTQLAELTFGEYWSPFAHLYELGEVGHYYDVACAALGINRHVLVYEADASAGIKGIQHAILGWSTRHLETIEARSLGQTPDRVACSPAAAEWERPAAGGVTSPG